MAPFPGTLDIAEPEEPLVTQPFAVEGFQKRQRYIDLSPRCETPHVGGSSRLVEGRLQTRARLVHTQFGAAHDCLGTLEAEEGPNGEGRLFGQLKILDPNGVAITGPLQVEVQFTGPQPDELAILEEHKQTILWAIEDMLSQAGSDEGGALDAPESYKVVWKELGLDLQAFNPASIRLTRSSPFMDENGKVLLGHYSSERTMYLHESQVDLLDVFIHQLLELWLPNRFQTFRSLDGRLHLEIPRHVSKIDHLLGRPTPGSDHPGHKVVSVTLDALIRGANRPRPEATSPPRSSSAALSSLGDTLGKGMLGYLILRRFSLNGVAFSPAEGFQVLTPSSHLQALDSRGIIAFEPHPDDVALFAGAYVSGAKGHVPIHLISAVPDPAGVTDQYLADLLALAALACGPEAAIDGSPRLIHARLVAQNVFPAEGEISKLVKGIFSPAEAKLVKERFSTTFPVLDTDEVARIKNLFSHEDWRLHKRSLRVYEGYLGFLYMGPDRGETAYTNLVWDLSLEVGAFAPKGTLLSYWSKFQSPNDKDRERLRQTLRKLQGYGTIILPAPHHRHPQHRQLTRNALPLILSELPGVNVMLYEDLTGFTHLRPNLVHCFDGATGMWMARVWEAFGSQEARNPYRSMWYNFVRRGAQKEAWALEAAAENRHYMELAERFLVGTLHWQT